MWLLGGGGGWEWGICKEMMKQKMTKSMNVLDSRISTKLKVSVIYGTGIWGVLCSSWYRCQVAVLYQISRRARLVSNMNSVFVWHSRICIYCTQIFKDLHRFHWTRYTVAELGAFSIALHQRQDLLTELKRIWSRSSIQQFLNKQQLCTLSKPRWILNVVWRLIISP